VLWILDNGLIYTYIHFFCNYVHIIHTIIDRICRLQLDTGIEFLKIYNMEISRSLLFKLISGFANNHDIKVSNVLVQKKLPL
jgi:hypothetical protein